VPRIFISHSTANSDAAVALYGWLEREGWKDEIFLDLDPKRGIAAGERWERALNEAANRCEAVLFLVSKEWIASAWCRKELSLAHRLNKRLYGVLIEDLPIEHLPEDLTGEWQFVSLASGRDHIMLRAVVPITHAEVHVTFSVEGLQRLKRGLEQGGLDPKYFVWPPPDDPDRPPYRGLRSLEAEDAGIFFGRDAPVVEALDRLRGLREATPPRLLVILGASGSGKSSFMRAGLLPRLARDDRYFLPLPIIRPERAVISGENGLLGTLEEAFRAARVAISRADLREAFNAGATKLQPLLQLLAEKATLAAFGQEIGPKPPTLVLPIDQGEELFLAEGQDETRAFLALLRNLLRANSPALIALFTIRSDAYEPLQLARELEGVRHEMINLPPMPRGSYAEVIKGPTLRLEGTKRPLKLEEQLVDALLADIEQGGGKDALSLLAFTLERLFLEYGGRGRLTLADYERLGRIKGSIEAAAERAFRSADANPRIPNDRVARLALLRRSLIPWLAGIDPYSGLPRRRVARLSEIPAEARPLIQHFVGQRLLSTDVAKDGETTIEPAHEALLRQWSLLHSWLEEDAGCLSVLEGVKRASSDWATNGKQAAWLVHASGRLEEAERLQGRPDLAAHLEPRDWEYLGACKDHEHEERRRREEAKIADEKFRRLIRRFGEVTAAAILVLLVLSGFHLWVKRNNETATWEMGWTALLTRTGLLFHKPTEPEMVAIAGGPFNMGSPALEGDEDEHPQHRVMVHAFEMGKYEVTFEQYDVFTGATLRERASDRGWGRGRRPVINVSWNDAMAYVDWLNRETGKNYRLPSEAEWEYAARAGTTTKYWWGNEMHNNDDRVNCNGCGSKWDGSQTAEVGSFEPNPWGLHDTAGNVWEWTIDCWHNTYENAPSDGSAWTDTNGDECKSRVVRGGSWTGSPQDRRSAERLENGANAAASDQGFRLARSLTH
jgi:formylglycine-generating enzyme required for sulfatase activity